MGWAAAFEKAFGLPVETFYRELEEFLQQPLAVQKAQLRHPPASTPTPTPNVGVVRILPGGSLSSPGGQYRLVYQSDGNLVLSDVLAGTALWATDTGGTAPGQAIVQSDGNFVIYDAAGSALWMAGTAGNPGAYLRIQDDGNVVIYGANARPIWSRLTGSLLPKLTGRLCESRTSGLRKNLGSVSLRECPPRGGERGGSRCHDVSTTGDEWCRSPSKASADISSFEHGT